MVKTKENCAISIRPLSSYFSIVVIISFIFFPCHTSAFTYTRAPSPTSPKVQFQVQKQFCNLLNDKKTCSKQTSTSPKGRFMLRKLFATHNDGNTYEKILDRLHLTSQFERWTFLQRLLDNELSPMDINELLYSVLKSWIDYPISDRGNLDASSPNLKDENIALLKDMVNSFQTDVLGNDGSIPVIEMDTQIKKNYGRDLRKDLESLLPDKYEDPDSYEGLWDLVRELHGEESVQYQEEKIARNMYDNRSNESDEDYDWGALCLVARILIHFDFLTEGISSKPNSS